MVLVFTATLFFYWQRQKEQKGEGERGENGRAGEGNAIWQFQLICKTDKQKDNNCTILLRHQ